MAESKTLAADRPRGRWAQLAPWLALIPFAGWSVLRLTGWEPKFRWSQLVSFTPYVAGASLLPLAVAVALRRWRAALAAAVVSGALGAAVLPRALPDCPPGSPKGNGCGCCRPISSMAACPSARSWTRCGGTGRTCWSCWS
ncbi:hypothetical protein [Microbispora sp. GKU 823]|uniref:hypothetical protein n=1 Tax=Microbispora sp. GKU 823 TaxID=1652100 RepID=UPI00117C2088|nr:hypothetical protein [Microbispora sp. GKU 823]